MLRTFLLSLGIAGAGAVGALARFGLQQLLGLIAGTGFPWGTLLINLSGAFLLGFVNTAFRSAVGAPYAWRIILGVGFLGAFTTFSSMMWESDDMLRHGNNRSTFGYLAASVIVGLFVVRLGFLAGQQFSGGSRP